MESIKIYVLTHKKFNEKLGSFYQPLLCGSKNLKEDFGYLRDDKGDNISNFNKYYAELTGEYWVWKNSKYDIIGFCHYRRFFMQNILLKKKLTKQDIENILSDYDIILPQITHLMKPAIEQIKINHEIENIGPNFIEYIKLREIFEEYYPEYIGAFDQVINSKLLYTNNMFITRRDLANNYFNWLFDILEKIKPIIDFNYYLKSQGQQRILGYLSETLLTVYVIHNKFKVKEKPVLGLDRRLPHIQLIERRFPSVAKLEKLVTKKGIDYMV